MIAAILNSAILDSAILHKKPHSFILTQLDDGSHLEFCNGGSDTAMLDSDTLLSSLRFTPKHSNSILTLTQTNSIWLKLIHSQSTWWWQPSWILPSWIWPSWIQPFLVFPLKLTYSCQDWFPPFAKKKKNITHSFWLDLMMAAILNSAILDSDTLLSFSQIHSKTLSLHSDSDSN